jgi:hypothetical protein
MSNIKTIKLSGQKSISHDVFALLIYSLVAAAALVIIVSVKLLLSN